MDDKQLNKEKKEIRKKYIITGKNKLLLLIEMIGTALLWLISAYFFKTELLIVYNYIMYSEGDSSFPTNIVEKLLLFALCVFLIISFWIIYNKLMFGGKDRRKASPKWSDEQIKNLYDIRDEQYNLFKTEKYLTIDFDEENKIEKVNNI